MQQENNQEQPAFDFNAAVQQRQQVNSITASDNFADEIKNRENSAATAVSPKGAKGTMQVMDSTAAKPGYGVAPAKDDSIAERDRVGRDYANTLLERYNGNKVLAAAAYNAGPQRVDQWISQFGDPRGGAITNEQFAQKIPIDETRNYVGGFTEALPPVNPNPPVDFNALVQQKQQEAIAGYAGSQIRARNQESRFYNAHSLAGANPVNEVSNLAQSTKDVFNTSADTQTGPDNFGTRFNMGLSEDFDSKAKKFSEAFGPEATLTQKFEATNPNYPNQKESVLYFTLHKGEQPVRFTQNTSTSIKQLGSLLLENAKNLGTEDTGTPDPEAEKAQAQLEAKLEVGYKNVMNNIIADNSGTLPVIIASALATGGAASLAESAGVLRYLSGFTGRVAAGTLGGGLGSLANSATEDLRGYTVKDPMGNAYIAAKDSAEGLLGGEVLGKFWRILKGEGLVHLDGSAKLLLKTSKDLNLPMPLPQQVLDSSIGLKRLTNQVGEMVPGFRRYAENQNQTATAFLRKLSPTKTDEFGYPILDENGLTSPSATTYQGIKENLQKAYDDFIKRLDFTNPYKKLKADDPFTGKPMHPYEIAGQNIKQGIEDYSNRSQQLVQQLYKNAEKIEEPKLDPTNLYSVIKDVETGKTAPGILKVERQIPPSSVTDEMGNPLRPGSNYFEEVPTTQTISTRITPALQDILEDIKGVDPKAMNVDVVNTLRQRLWNYINPDAVGRVQAGTVNAADTDAARAVYNSFNTMLENPANANAEFNQAWKQASFAARMRFENLEAAKVVQAAKAGEGDITSTLEGFARTLATSPTQLSNLRLFEKVLTPQQFDTIGRSVEQVIRETPFDQPELATKVIQKFMNDKYARSLLWNNDYFDKTIKPLYKVYDGLSKTNIPAVLQSQDNAFQIIKSLTRAGEANTDISTAGVNHIYKVVGGIDSAAGRDIRAGIIDHMLQGASNRVKDYSTIDGAKLVELISSAQNKNLLQFLTPQDITNMKGAAYYLSYIQKAGVDSGSSLQSASEFARLRHFQLHALLDFGKAQLISKILVSRPGQRLFYGTGTAPEMSKTFLPILGETMRNLSETEDAQEQNSTTAKPSWLSRQFNTVFGGNK